MVPNIPILYEDAHLLVCCKPVGVLSEPHNGTGLPELLAQQQREAGKPDFISGVHRLDRNVGGLMIFSRRQNVTGKLIAQVAEHRMGKEYIAILRGSPAEPAAVLEDLLLHDKHTNKTFCVKRIRKGVRDAKLEYRTLAQATHEGQTLTLVRIRLHTGRTHQIRAQFSSRGLPLLGDIRYGSKDNRCDAALWSCMLDFSHPVTQTRICIQLPPPDAYPWSLFQRTIAEEFTPSGGPNP